MAEDYKVFAVNSGSTSTKVALFVGKKKSSNCIQRVEYLLEFEDTYAIIESHRNKIIQMEKEPPEVAASGGSCIMMMQYVGWLSYLFPSNHLLIKYETIPAITEIINEIK